MQNPLKNLRLGLRLKFNLVLLAVAVIGVGLFALISAPFLKEQARQEVLVRSRIMTAAGIGIRLYTGQEVAPLLNHANAQKFDPQAIGSYAATKSFAVLKTDFPDYNFSVASLNPFNQENRARDWQADIINELRGHPDMKEAVTVRDTPEGPMLNLSRPVIAAASCLSCHDSPDLAPLAMLAVYGKQNGFGFKLNEVMAIQTVSVPMTVPLQNGRATLYLFMGLLAVIFALIILLTNLLMSFSIIRPILRMSRIAGDVSMGKANVEEYVKSGSDEVSSLSVSLNRMKRSVDEAIKLLDAHQK
jgi:protein-histidine pros-kinase